MSLNYLHLPFDPIADPAAVVTAGNVRFTVLTARLLRLEYSPTSVFEDRPSQAFCYRRQPVPAFNVRRGDGSIEIETEHLLLRCTEHPRGFTPVSLCAHAWAAAGAASCVGRVGAVLNRTYGKPSLSRRLVAAGAWTRAKLKGRQ